MSNLNTGSNGDLEPFLLHQNSDSHYATAAAVYTAITGYYRDVSTWYLREKESKKRASKALRALSLLMAVGGGVVPLTAAAGLGSNPSAGYVLLALAGGLQVADRYFGYSEAWSRYVAVAMKCNALSIQLQVEWSRIAACTPGGHEDGTWQLLAMHAGLLGEVVSSETADWSNSLRESIEELRNQARSTP